MSTHPRFDSRSLRPIDAPYEWGFDALPRERLAALKCCLDSVDDLDAERWLRIGREATAHCGRTDDWRGARARLERVITAERLVFASWFVYDALDAAAESILLAAHLRDQQTCAAVHAARDVLYYVLMAVAVRDRLDASDYGALSACCRTSIST